MADIVGCNLALQEQVKVFVYADRLVTELCRNCASTASTTGLQRSLCLSVGTINLIKPAAELPEFCFVEVHKSKHLFVRTASWPAPLAHHTQQSESPFKWIKTEACNHEKVKQDLQSKISYGSVAVLYNPMYFRQVLQACVSEVDLLVPTPIAYADYCNRQAHCSRLLHHAEVDQAFVYPPAATDLHA